MHFSVLVIGDNVEELMKPYQENNMGDCPQEYLEFEEEYSAEDFALKSENEKDGIAEDYEEHNGAYGYWCNPNSIWDWYEVGGRWAGMLTLKKDVDKSKYPPVNFSWGWDEESKDEVNKEHRVDSAQIKDIDWEAMRNKVYEHRLQKFKKVLKTFEGKIPDNDHDFNEKLMEGIRGEGKGNGLNFGDRRDQFNFETPEAYAEHHAKNFFGTYYVVDEDQYHCVDGEDGFFDKYIKDLDPETTITIVDCHS